MERPNPDILLEKIVDETEKQQERGRLKIFFGYAAGVGKTYAMLEAAHEAKKKGIDVVAGYIEPHTRPETMALLDGLEQLPPKAVQYKGMILKEFDLDAAITRKPQLILVDELAHTNASACRHSKRYQDVEELLKAGIDVYTTINVQHIESLNDIVASITGVVVRERIPDSVFDSADQVELVDIEPDDLLERLHKGKIYAEDKAYVALKNFFVKENLIALREIALRRTADRVNKIAEKTKKNMDESYYTEEHVLICLSGSPSNAKVIRTAARMADAFRGSFTALYVESANHNEMNPENAKRLKENLRLAQQLGARIVTVYGDDIPYQISAYAKASGVSKIVIGRSNNKRNLLSVKPNFVERLTVLAPNIDIYIIPDNLPPYRGKKTKRQWKIQLSALDVIKTIIITMSITLLNFLFYYWGFNDASIVTVFILGALLVSIFTNGRIYGATASLCNVFLFNFFFTEPRFTFIAKPEYIITFGIMFLASFLSSTLTMQVKRQAYLAARKAYRTEVLLETSQKLQKAKNTEQIITEAAHQFIKLLDRTIIVYFAKHNKLMEPVVYTKNEEEKPADYYITPDEQGVALWVYKNNKHAGATTNTLPGAKCLYLAVRNHEAVSAVVGIAMEGTPALETMENNILVALLSEFALALEKEQMQEKKNQIAMQAQQDQLRANLLRTISHDLRTPLTGISGNAGILMNNSDHLTPEKRMELYSDIYDDSMWLMNLVENLLSITRIENGTMHIHMEPELLSDVIQEAMQHLDRRSIEHHITVDIADDLLMAKMDSRLMVQVFINMLDNAIKYTQKGSHITVKAKRRGDRVAVTIADDGPGLSPESKNKIFDMFYTADNTKGDSRRGLGLGLSLCKSIILAHGGDIQVKDNKPHGTVFAFTLPAEEVEYHE